MDDLTLYSNIYTFSPEGLSHTIKFNSTLAFTLSARPRFRRQTSPSLAPNPQASIIPSTILFTCGFVNGYDRTGPLFPQRTSLVMQRGKYEAVIIAII